MAASTAEATRQHAVELLNEAKISENKEKGRLLEQVIELVVRKEPSLSGDFVEGVCELQVDTSPAVRKLVAGFAEELAGVVPTVKQMHLCVACIASLLRDSANAVIKRAISAASSAHRVVVNRLAETMGMLPEEKATWEECCAAKATIYRLQGAAETPGAVRLMAVKFVETVVLLYTHPMLRIPPGNALLSHTDLVEEASTQVSALAALLDPGGSVPNQVLIVAIQACGEIARSRPQYFGLVAKAVHAYAASADLTVGSGPGPQTSLAHTLKKILVDLLRMRVPEAGVWRQRFVDALQAIGASDAAAEAVRKAEKTARREEKERNRAAATAVVASAGGDVDMGEEEEEEQEEGKAPAAAAPAETGAEELGQVQALLVMLLEKRDMDTMRGFIEQLPPAVMADVVMANMANLPEPPPPDPTDPSGSAAGIDSLAGLIGHINNDSQTAKDTASNQELKGGSVKREEAKPAGDAAPPRAPMSAAPPPRAVPSIPKLAPVKLSTAALASLQRSAVTRLLPGDGVRSQLRLPLRASLLSKLATLGQRDEELEAMLRDAIVGGPRQAGLELATRWLHCLFLKLCEASAAEAGH
eukprot:CAMPEP_0117679310 /NCGR_PEP_ID=MMETSP0804-20121206/17749_1 /TAXON_ID=1074897 /ORGANISM="Tetraselmis astigmatica, Strain CCMP880" /LENGTH=586 /DNA_ID=CAMNT_0005488729 /DNA_START=387 /DNA_END=2144 /DNA_ORIENTATION=-